MDKAFRTNTKLFYVRGYIMETHRTVVLLLAKDEVDAANAASEFGITGDVTVIPQDEWDGIKSYENFIIGYRT
jgi:hypothetical protein